MAISWGIDREVYEAYQIHNGDEAIYVFKSEKMGQSE